jgi:hypothetical protein
MQFDYNAYATTLLDFSTSVDGFYSNLTIESRVQTFFVIVFLKQSQLYVFSMAFKFYAAFFLLHSHVVSSDIHHTFLVV